MENKTILLIFFLIFMIVVALMLGLMKPDPKKKYEPQPGEMPLF